MYGPQHLADAIDQLRAEPAWLEQTTADVAQDLSKRQRAGEICSETLGWPCAAHRKHWRKVVRRSMREPSSTGKVSFVATKTNLVSRGSSSPTPSAQ